jgi:hypothetical protein
MTGAGRVAVGQLAPFSSGPDPSRSRRPPPIGGDSAVIARATVQPAGPSARIARRSPRRARTLGRNNGDGEQRPTQNDGGRTCLSV